MLILTRKISQSLVIDDDIYCTILGVSGNHVRLGFNAPKSKPIHREEIHQKIQQKRLYDELNHDVYIDESYLTQLDEQLKQRCANKISH